MVFEHRREPLISRREFYRRIIRHLLFAILLICFSLFIGVLGYHLTEGLSWLDSLLNASMILTGMGPVDVMRTSSGKLFASFYALFSGIAFITIVGVTFAPVFHRFLHKFHLEFDSDSEDSKK